MAARTMDTGPGQRELAEQARAAAKQAKQRVAESVGSQKSSVTRDIRGVARALRTTADECEGEEQPFIAGYARRAADGVERLGEVLERKDLSEMVRDLERVCRDRPLLVGGAALLAGFMGTRLARTAVSARREQSEPEPEYEVSTQREQSEPEPEYEVVAGGAEGESVAAELEYGSTRPAGGI